MSSTEEGTPTSKQTATSTIPMITTDLKLDNDDDHPRRFLTLPTGQILAYGGDDGSISLVVSNTTDDNNKSVQVTTARRFDDDAVRALAVSTDGKIVAVGLDSGATQLYSYANYNASTDKNHPFVCLSSNDDDNKKDTDDDQDDNLFSQSDTLTHSVAGETCQAGPCFDSPVRDLCFVGKDNKNLAMASESGLCVVALETENDNKLVVGTRYLQEEAATAHDHGGVRAVTVQGGDNDVLASLGMDGRCCLWNVAGSTAADYKLLERDASLAVTKKDVGEILGADAWDRSCQAVFIQPTLLALPGATYLQLRSIVNCTVTDYDQPETETTDGPHQGHVESIVCMASLNTANDPYVITSGRDGRVVVWKVDQDEDGTWSAAFVRQLGQFKSEPTGLLWNKDAKGIESLFVACANGSLVTIQGRENIAPKAKKQATKKPIKSTDNAKAPEAKTSRISKKVTIDIDSDDDEDIAFDAALDDAPRANPFVDDEAADEESASSLAETGTAAPTATSNTEGVITTTSHDSEDDMDAWDADIPAAPSAQMVQYQALDLPEPQPAFAPSSTPLELTRRYMCWNHIGSVTLLQGELGVSRSNVDIDFTDSAFRRPISFTDNMGFILGSLGEDGGIFATDVTDEDDLDDAAITADLGDVVNNMSEATKAAVKRSQRSREGGTKATGSTIYFHRFETFGSLRDKDWYLTLPAGERALGCACGESWAAVVTSRRFLRLFSSGGNQGQVIWLDGEPITMVGRSRFLAVFYHESTPLPDGTQKLGYLLFDGMTSRTIAKGSVSGISKGSSLSWAGFSNDGSLLVMDTDGMVSMLVCVSAQDTDSIASTWEWMPMLDTVGLRKSADDSYWPVTMYDAKLICVPLKGGTKHPDAARRPVTAALGLRIPLARGALTKSNALEELAVRAGIALGQKKVMHEITAEGEIDDEFEREYTALSAQVDKVTLKMFATTVEAGKLERALDLVERLHLEKSLNLAMTIADSHRKLVDLIEDVKDRKFAPADDYAEPEFTDQPYDDEDTSQRISPDADQARKGKRNFGDDPLDNSGPMRQVRQKANFA